MKSIKFGTDGWRAIIAEDFTIDNLIRVATATAEWILTLKSAPVAVVGNDCRFGGKLFSETTATVLAENGIKVKLAKNSFVSTPMVSLGTFAFEASAGIIITASHNPYTYNGFKIKASYGGPAVPAMIDDVEKRIPNFVPSIKNSFNHYLNSGLIEYVDLEALYIAEAQKCFDLETIKKSKMNLAYDAMFGAGQNVISTLLPDSYRIHCEHNPNFGTNAPEPILKNLKELQLLMQNNENLQLGLATDGDADRIGLMDEKGNFVDSHHIILLLIHYLYKYKNLSGKVAVSFSCTQKIKNLCELYNLPYEVTPIGFKYICEIMTTEDVLVGGEESGGIAVKGFIPERDGIWNGLVLLEFMAKTGKNINQLIQEIYDLVGPFAMDRLDLHIDNDLKMNTIAKCKNSAFKHFGKYKVITTNDLDGFKFHFENDRWAMIRPSGTEPVLRVYAEAESKAEVDEILALVKNEIFA